MPITRRGGISAAERLSLANLLKADLLAAGGGAIVKLYKNDITPTPATLLANFTEADFIGYASYAVSNWQANFFRNAAQLEVYNTVVAGFQAGALTGAQTVYGWYIVDDTTELVLYGWGRFDTPELLTANGDTIVFEAAFGLPTSTGQWSV